MKLLRRGVVIVGGGIAGCSLAILLAQRGVRVTVLEKQDVWRFNSSGIFVYSNGLAELEKVGVLPEILKTGFVIEGGRNIYFDQHGEVITETVYPSAPGTTLPSILGIRRAELHRVLTDRMRALGVAIRLGTTVLSIDDHADDGHPLVATLSDGSTLEADLLVGADGIRSQVRRMLWGDMEPDDTGFGVWRSIHARPPALREKILMMGVGKRLGIMPISEDQLYIYATTNEPGHPRYEPSALHLTMREKFAEFAGPATALLEDIRDPAQVVYTAVEEIRLPLPWHKGRVLLIGDAAHASTPFMGQGGTMAVEDGNVLADLLEGGTDLLGVLRQFGLCREPKCQFVQEVSRRVGEAGGLESAATCAARNDRMRVQAQGDVDSFYRRLHEFDLATA